MAVFNPFLNFTIAGINIDHASQKFCERVHTPLTSVSREMLNLLDYVRFWEVKGVRRSKKDVVMSPKSIGEVLMKVFVCL